MAITFTRNTSTPLRGLGDFVLTKPASNEQGYGVSTALTIDSADQAKILRVIFDFKTSVNYVAGDIRVYLYDVTNAQLIEPTVRDLEAVGGNGQYISEFQSNSNSTSYRLIFHVASVNADAYTVNLDNVSVGPREIARGPMITAWQSYTPAITGVGTLATNAAFYRRVGDSIEIRGIATCGTPAAAQFQIPFPSGLVSAGSDRLAAGSNLQVGFMTRYVGGATISRDHILHVLPNQAYVTAGILEYTPDTNPTISQNGNAMFGASNVFSYYVSVPILGFGASSTLSSDFGGRILAARAFGNSTGAGTSGTIVYTSVDYDTAAQMSGGVFTAKETGWYSVDWRASSSSISLSTTQRFMASLRKNGTTTIAQGARTLGNGATNLYISNGSSDVYLLKDETLSILYECQVSTTVGDGEGTYFSVHKIQTPQSLAGSEKELASVRMNANQVVSTVGANVVFNQKIKDTHGNYSTSTGFYTCGRAGDIFIFGQIASDDITAGSNTYLEIGVNGTSIYHAKAWQTSNDTTVQIIPVSISFPVNKGDIIRLVHVSGDSTRNIIGLGAGLYFSYINFEVR